jgi:uncharacterized protein
VALGQSSGPRPLSIWAVADGRAGIENQTVGLAEAVARLTRADITIKRLTYQPLFDRWPNALRLFPNAMLAAQSDRIEPPFPDLMIAAGRASLPFSTRVGRWSEGRTFVVQVQAPRTSLAPFDLVVPPRHDGLVGERVLPILGSPNRITPERIAAEGAGFADRIDPLPHPRVAVLVGGASKRQGLTCAQSAALADRIATAVADAGGSVLVTYSRRTPPMVQAAMTERLSRIPGWIWDGEGDNPYFALLGAADHILVTEDSVNMAVEAASTGRSVHVLKMGGKPGKIGRLHEELARMGISRPFDGTLDAWSYTPLAETDRAAREILARMAERTA